MGTGKRILFFVKVGYYPLLPLAYALTVVVYCL